MDALINFLISIVAFFALLGAIFVVLFFVGRRIKKRGELVRALNMELFLILIPREAPPQEENEKQITEKEKIQPMEQLFGIFSNLTEKGLFRIFEFGKPIMSWEMVYRGGEIAFYVAVPSRYTETLVRAVHAVYPDAVVERTEDYDIFNPQGPIAASYVMTSRTALLPIRTYASLERDPLNSLTSLLAKLSEEEGAAVQVLIRPTKKKWGSMARKVALEMQRGKSFERALHDAAHKFFEPPSFKHRKPIKEGTVATPQDQEIIKAIEEKSAHDNFEVNVRLVASAPTQEQSEMILYEMERTFSQYSTPTLNYFSEVREDHRRIAYEFSFRIFHPQRSIVLSTEELTSIYHLPISGSHLPKVKWLKTRSAPAPWGMNEGIALGINEYRGQEIPVRLATQDRGRHVYIVGQTGTGKTSLLQTMVAQDIQAGNGICIIEPHDLVEKTLQVIPQERWEDVIVLNPTDLDRPFGLNMLEFDPNFPEQKTFIINELINIFDKLYDLKQTGGPMFEQYTRNALLLLMEYPDRGYTLMEIPRVLSDKEFRTELLSNAKNIVVRDFWEKEAEKAGGEAALANMVPYITSKFNVFIANDFTRPIIGQAKSSINFRKVMDEGKILLVNLAKGRLGEANMSLLGLIVVGKLMMASFSRADLPEAERRDFYLYIDEFQNFTTDSIATILSEARKYRLNLTIAHQFLAQVPETISKAVFGNVGTMVLFRVGQEDAEFLAHYLSPLFSAHDLVNLDNFHSYVRLMFQGAVTPPFNMKLYYPPKGNPETARVIENISRLKYGKDKELVDEEIEMRYRGVPKVMETAAPEFTL